MEVNTRAVYACSRIGVGYVPLKKLCGYMNMPPPMAKTGYDYICNKIKDTCKKQLLRKACPMQRKLSVLGKKLLSGYQ